MIYPNKKRKKVYQFGGAFDSADDVYYQSQYYYPIQTPVLPAPQVPVESYLGLMYKPADTAKSTDAAKQALAKLGEKMDALPQQGEDALGLARKEYEQIFENIRIHGDDYVNSSDFQLKLGNISGALDAATENQLKRNREYYQSEISELMAQTKADNEESPLVNNRGEVLVAKLDKEGKYTGREWRNVEGIYDDLIQYVLSDKDLKEKTLPGVKSQYKNNLVAKKEENASKIKSLREEKETLKNKANRTDAEEKRLNNIDAGIAALIANNNEIDNAQKTQDNYNPDEVAIASYLRTTPLNVLKDFMRKTKGEAIITNVGEVTDYGVKLRYNKDQPFAQEKYSTGAGKKANALVKEIFKNVGSTTEEKLGAIGSDVVSKQQFLEWYSSTEKSNLTQLQGFRKLAETKVSELQGSARRELTNQLGRFPTQSEVDGYVADLLASEITGESVIELKRQRDMRMINDDSRFGAGAYVDKSNTSHSNFQLDILGLTDISRNLVYDRKIKNPNGLEYTVPTFNNNFIVTDEFKKIGSLDNIETISIFTDRKDKKDIMPVNANTEYHTIFYNGKNERVLLPMLNTNKLFTNSDYRTKAKSYINKIYSNANKFTSYFDKEQGKEVIQFTPKEGETSEQALAEIKASVNGFNSLIDTQAKELIKNGKREEAEKLIKDNHIRLDKIDLASKVIVMDAVSLSNVKAPGVPGTYARTYQDGDKQFLDLRIDDPIGPNSDISKANEKIKLELENYRKGDQELEDYDASVSNLINHISTSYYEQYKRKLDTDKARGIAEYLLQLTKKGQEGQFFLYNSSQNKDTLKMITIDKAAALGTQAQLLNFAVSKEKTGKASTHSPEYSGTIQNNSNFNLSINLSGDLPKLTSGTSNQILKNIVSFKAEGGTIDAYKDGGVIENDERNEFAEPNKSFFTPLTVPIKKIELPIISLKQLK